MIVIIFINIFYFWIFLEFDFLGMCKEDGLGVKECNLKNVLLGK